MSILAPRAGPGGRAACAPFPARISADTYRLSLVMRVVKEKVRRGLAGSGEWAGDFGESPYSAARLRPNPDSSLL